MKIAQYNNITLNTQELGFKLQDFPPSHLKGEFMGNRLHKTKLMKNEKLLSINIDIFLS